MPGICIEIFGQIPKRKAAEAAGVGAEDCGGNRADLKLHGGQYGNDYSERAAAKA